MSKPDALPRVAVLLPVGSARDSVRRAIERTHDLDVLTDIDGLLSRLANVAGGAVDVVLIDWSMLGSDAVRTFRALRAHAPTTPFLALLDRTPFSEMPAIFAAGVADLIRTPINADELAARIGRARLHVSASASIPSISLEHVPDALALDLSAFLGVKLSVEAGPGLLDLEGEQAVSCLPLHLVRDSLEVRVFVAISRAHLPGLTRMLGIDVADPLLTNDLGCELVNLAAGSLRRTCSTPEATLTMGLPRSVEPGGLPANAWSACLLGDGGQVTIFVEQIHRAPSLVRVGALREGMVVVVDLKSETGTLLLAAGSRLTTTTASRVAKMLPAQDRVQVFDLC